MHSDEITDIAGYSLSVVYMYYMYTVENDSIITDNDQVKLYQAEYLLSPTELNTAYDELKEKLSLLYGNGIEDTDKSYLHKIRTTWTADDGTYIQLQKESSHIRIVYNAKKELVDSWNLEIEEEYKRQEKENTEGNFNGL